MVLHRRLQTGLIINAASNHVDQAIDLAARSLWEAADADSATGGPDALRGIYPVVATVTAAGWERLTDDELAVRYAAIAQEVTAR